MPDARPAPPISLKALLTGQVTPEKRAAISAWLTGILNPEGTVPGPRLRTQQFGTIAGGAPDPTVNQALRLVGDQYPEAVMRSRSLSVLPGLDHRTMAQRDRATGHIMVNPSILPQDDQPPTLWNQQFLGLLDTLRHEYSHGMGLLDNSLPGDDPDQYPTAYDVNKVSARLHEDVALPPPPKRGR